jgi:hypothetical protein
MKNKEKKTFNLKLNNSQALSAMLGDIQTTIPIKVKAIVDKYMTAINHQLHTNVEDNPLKLLQIRLVKGEISKTEYEELKEILVAS